MNDKYFYQVVIMLILILYGGKNAKKRPRIRSKTFFYFPNV